LSPRANFETSEELIYHFVEKHDNVDTTTSIQYVRCGLNKTRSSATAEGLRDAPY